MSQQEKKEQIMDNWKICIQKMKTFQRPFQMKDKTERIKDIKYQFKIYHPDVKNDEQIKQILLQRKQQNEQQKLIERKKKAFYKLQFELKHFTKSQLLTKYPNLTELIEKLPDPQKPKSCQFKEQDQSLNVSQERQSGLTWESLNKLPLVTDFLKDLMDQQEEEDDIYLQEYQEQKLLNNSPKKIIKSNRYHSIPGYQNERQKRSVSDHKQIIKISKQDEQNSIERLNEFEIQGKIIKFKTTTNNVENKQSNNFISLLQLNSNQIRQKILRQQKQQLQQQNYSVEMPRQNTSLEYNDPHFLKDKSIPNKLNISMLKRVQQISGLEAIKEQNLLNQIISQQREKIKIAKK
ncbi:unnamed protein product [Paramecium pentaurelia]|uniref:Uncharacterized protein n=1 Tax=Paramecium pentaurelia TaxID=43138 RepID=A0A8S1XZW0_9CILI|nr:unnamed protein product [Paramecium pentaurelia]